MGSACFVTNKRAWITILKYVRLFKQFFFQAKKYSPKRAFRRLFQNYLRIHPSFFRYRDIPWMLSFLQHSTPPWGGEIKEPLKPWSWSRWIKPCKTSIFPWRGSGAFPKGQHSWNISVTKEARVDPKVVLESSVECSSRGTLICP